MIGKALKRKEWAYRKVFLGSDGELNEAGKIVMADLVKFTGLHKTVATSELDAYGAEKARQPVKRILNFLKIDHIETYDIQEEYDELET